MLTYCQATNLYSLADRLIEEREEGLSGNVLAPEIFVVQNHGMANWLSLYVAEKKGVAANMEFEFPAERIWKLIRTIDSDIPEDLPSDRHPMTWSLYRLLQEGSMLSSFPELSYYIGGSSGDMNAMRAWKLSAKIADVFDQYLIYRPELISAWEQGKLYNGKSRSEKWQAKLWQRLNSYWKKNYDPTWIHRVQLQEELLKRIESGALDSSALPGRISVFGVSVMPPGFTEIMTKLSRLTDISFYQLRPTEEDSQAGGFENPLLQSLGALCEEQKKVLHDSITKVGDCDAVALSSNNEGPDNLFRAVRSDLVRDAANKDLHSGKTSADGSIQVHSCHSAMREVEVLYDELLAKLDADPELTPNDILIMTPDIDIYAPTIEAVFGSPQEGQPRIPYSIVDGGNRNAESAINIFLQILDLCESRFKVTEVIDLLESEAIKEAYGFDEEDLNYLGLWIEENNIKWGIDAAFKNEMNLPESESFTWKSGLNRIVAGYMLKPGEDELYNGTYPYSEIESSGSAELAGSFSSFIEHLSELSRYVKKEQVPKEWARRLSETVSLMLPDSKDYFREITKLREALDHLHAFARLGGYTSEVPFGVVRNWLQDYLQSQPTGGGGLGRGVTFSSLRPMRSIPFRMIGMIGMNEGAFPKSKIPIEFSLIEAEPRIADPDRAKEDRYLLLENIISSQSSIYFSYVGQSNRQDSSYPPSVVVRELLDYLKEYYGIAEKDLVKRHRLHGFSDAYFDEDDLFTYSKTYRNINDTLVNGIVKPSSFLKEPLPDPEEEWRKLSVQDLISFYQHPAKFLLNNRLGIYLGDQTVIYEDREPFSLKGLDDYKVGQELLDRFMNDKSLEEYEHHLRARDMLPEGWSGKRAYQSKVDRVKLFGSNLKDQLSRQKRDDIEVKLSIGDFQLLGRLDQVYEDGLIDYRFGSTRPKNLIELWVNHLCLQLCSPDGYPSESRLFTLEKKKPFEEHKVGPVENAEEILMQLLRTYRKGLQECTYLFTDSSYAFAYETLIKGGDVSSGRNKASKTWTRDWGTYPGEGEDPYNRLLLGSQNPLKEEEFQRASVRFWQPFFDALSREDS